MRVVKKHSVIQKFNISDKELEKYLDLGYEIKVIVPYTKYFNNCTLLETRCFYVLVKTTESVAD